MITGIREHFSNKFVAILIASVFVMTSLACFAMTTTRAHAGEVDKICETVMSLADSTIVQTGVVLPLVLAAAWLGTGSKIFPTQSELNLRLIRLYGPPLDQQVLSREYSYLSQLFSSGIIHSKLHSTAV
jgi:hypothetical protein